MSKDEAIQALNAGCKVTHRLFVKRGGYKWIMLHGDIYRTNDNQIIPPEIFWKGLMFVCAWDYDWDIFED